jgi:hypothetical protein
MLWDGGIPLLRHREVMEREGRTGLEHSLHLTVDFNRDRSIAQRLDRVSRIEGIVGKGQFLHNPQLAITQAYKPTAGEHTTKSPFTNDTRWSNPAFLVRAVPLSTCHALFVIPTTLQL